MRPAADVDPTTPLSTVLLDVAADGVDADEAPRQELAAAVSGPGLTVRMGSALLRRALDACLGPEVLMEFASGDRAVRLSSPHQPGFLALVMPAPR